jgi:cob(I)alamin adenosyltransferase
MRIYTRTGDKGDTSLRWGERVPKNALRVEVYGTVDEANAHVGMAVAMMEGPAFAAVREVLLRVQNELFYVGADLATPPSRERGEQPRITQASVDALGPTSTGWRPGCPRSGTSCSPVAPRRRLRCTSPARWCAARSGCWFP